MEKRNLFIVLAIGIMIFTNGEVYAHNNHKMPKHPPRSGVYMHVRHNMAPPPVIYRPYYGFNVNYPPSYRHTLCPAHLRYGCCHYPYQTGVNFGINISI